MLRSLYDVCVVTGLLSVVAMVVGCVALLTALWRDPERRRSVWLLAAPISAPTLFVVFLIVIARVSRHPGESGVHFPAPVAIGVMLLGAAAIVVCSVSPPAVMRRLAAPAAALRASVIAMVPVVATTMIAACASVAYAIVLGDLTPRLDATVARPVVVIPYALVMGSACIAAAASSLRGLRRLITPST